MIGDTVKANFTIRRKKTLNQTDDAYKSLFQKKEIQCMLFTELGEKLCLSGRTQDLGHSFFPCGPPAYIYLNYNLFHCSKLLNKYKHWYTLPPAVKDLLQPITK